MNRIEIIGNAKLPGLKTSQIRAFVNRVLTRLEIDRWRMGLFFVDDEVIRGFNRQYRSMDVPTDVLSFSQDEGERVPRQPGAPVEAGDVVISAETVVRNARQWDNPFEEELARVIIHGILHLNGMDHPGDDYESGMLKKQEELLAETGGMLKNTE